MTAVTWDGVARGYIPAEPLTIDPGLARHEARSADVDPVTFEVIRYALLNANVEHGQTLQRLCVSPITMLTRDFQPSILTQDGELVFLGPYLQYFSNAQSLTIKWILENRSASPGIGPGDMFLSNDPYVGTPHQPDTIVAAPVFAGQQLFCWVANVLHHSDIGGSVVGSFCVDAPDIFTDPSAFPPFKIVEAGRVRTDMEGPVVTAGYRNRPDADTFRPDGWLRIGDVGRADAGGYVQVLDRMKDMIIRGGENIYSLEVESVLARHPAIAEVAVVGVPDPVMGERVRAVAVLGAGQSLALGALQEWAGTQLADYKLPAELVTVGSLPRNASGKVMKKKLAEPPAAAAAPPSASART